ncbi:MAG: DNA cytosine methyltransferase, partial [Candidatus Microthrix sp.]|nr:DNA cytosine methyltransferase [Candidatus Microthrix sp.]
RPSRAVPRMTGRLLSLFSGYGGLDMAIESVLDVRTAYVADIDPGARKVLAHRFPDAPNLGDVTAVDWPRLGPIDVIAGGSPCQDLSHAGRRAGMTEGTRSNLWVAMREAIAALRPSLVVWENVRGAYSAGADSALEFCAGCMGEGRLDAGPVLRALGRVLGDLSDLGYDAVWHGLRAADVGAPHGRFRVFVLAYPEGDDTRWWPTGPGEAEGGRARGDAAGRGLLPTPTTRDHKGANQRGDDTCLTGALLPTPRATDGTKGGPNQRGSSGDLMLPSAVMQLLPTPSVADVMGGRKARSGERNDEPLLNGIAHANLWGDYAAAIARWEAILGRPAPEPTQTSAKGNPQLSPRFVEWMMGVPDGWITDVPGITRNEALKACGNGVVPQQAEAAIRTALAYGRQAAA